MSNDDDTLALYHFDEDEGELLKDSSGHRHNGKIMGANWVRIGGTTPPAASGSNGLAPPLAIAAFDAATAKKH